MNDPMMENYVTAVQNGITSIDEIREKLDLPPWGIPEISEPVVFAPQGPIPISMAPQLIEATLGKGEEVKTSFTPAQVAALLLEFQKRINP